MTQPVTNLLYRKKPIEIEAMLFPDNWPGQADVFKWMEGHGVNLGLYDGNVEGDIQTSTGATWRWRDGSIPTPEGVMSVRIGDYVIRGVKGEFYPCKPDIFEMTYDKV